MIEKIIPSLMSKVDIITPFKQRVATDSGTFESEQCLRAELNAIGINYLRAKIVISPNGYKANKVYALKPTNGDADLATVRTSVATRRRSSDGKIESVSTGVPRLRTRFGSTCPELMSEGTAKTNLILRSEEFDNASWTKTNVTVSADSVSGPGTGNADSILETVTSGQHRVEQAITKAGSNLTYAFRFFIKANGRDWIYVSIRNGGNGFNRWLNISTITRGTLSQFGSGFLHQSASIEDAGDGWRRVEVTSTSNTTTALTVLVANTTGDGSTTDFTGDTSKGFYIWGAHLEQASFTSSYIPTTSASVTRAAETISNKTGLSSYLPSTAGTLYFKGFADFDHTDRRITLTDGTSGKRVILNFTTADKVRLYIENSGAQADITSADTFRTESEFRVVMTWQSNKAALFVNGVKEGEDLSVTVPSGLDRITFDDSSTTFIGYIKALLILDSALTDNQAIQLSTPTAYPPVIKRIIPLTVTGNPDYYGFGNGINLSSISSVFTDISIYIAKRGPEHYLGGGNMFGMLYNAKFNLWTSVFQVIDSGTTYYSGVSAGLVGNRIFIQIARYTVSGGVDTFADIGYVRSVDLTTLTAWQQLKDSSSWSTFTALPTPTYNRYEAYGKISSSTANANTYYGAWFEHNGVNHRLNIRKIVETSPGTYTITNIQVHDSTNDYGEPSLCHAGGSNWLIFARQNDSTEMIHLFSSTDDCATWSNVGDTNLGSSSGDCVIDSVLQEDGNIYLIFQDRGTGYIMESKNNTYAQCLSLTLNTAEKYDYNAINDATLNGLGYPSVWKLRTGVYYKTWIKESSSTEAHVYGTLDSI